MNNNRIFRFGAANRRNNNDNNNEINNNGNDNNMADDLRRRERYEFPRRGRFDRIRRHDHIRRTDHRGRDFNFRPMNRPPMVPLPPPVIIINRVVPLPPPVMVNTNHTVDAGGPPQLQQNPSCSRFMDRGPADRDEPAPRSARRSRPPRSRSREEYRHIPSRHTSRSSDDSWDCPVLPYEERNGFKHEHEPL